MNSNENISPSVLNRLIKEVKEYSKNPVSDITLEVNEENFTDIRAEISGPAETPYHGGSFKVKLVFGPDFPSAPPKGFFVTPIFHPNVAKNGEICVNTLKKDWKSDLPLSHVLMAIRCLLIEPNPESALNEEAGRMFMEDYETYSSRAKLMTNIHAAKEDKTDKEVGEGADVPGDLQSPKKISKKDQPTDKKKMEKKRSLKRL
mmetsp:Transcript_18909/g.29559  ORF Transcript_18909/g.29559 Transcript_18909/m.29559 type:complete len:203 (-) Transcript_18909:785-1393(-)